MMSVSRFLLPNRPFTVDSYREISTKSTKERCISLKTSSRVSFSLISVANCSFCFLRSRSIQRKSNNSKRISPSDKRHRIFHIYSSQSKSNLLFTFNILVHTDRETPTHNRQYKPFGLFLYCISFFFLYTHG